MIAMRERNAGVIRRRHDGRNARHDFKWEFSPPRALRLPRRRDQNIRVAALEPHDVLPSRARAMHEFGDLLLRKLRAFAARNDFRRRLCEPEQFGIHQHVINDHVRAPEQFRAAQREQASIARPRADEFDNLPLLVVRKAAGQHVCRPITDSQQGQD
jgi:hypothetical protein